VPRQGAARQHARCRGQHDREQQQGSTWVMFIII